jgi:uncharacterized glyoxalase superfamily protein PhnB
MSKQGRTISQINLVARQFDETLAFYRLIGLDIPEPMAQPPGTLHAPAELKNGFEFEIDNEYLARIYNAAWRRSTGSSSLLLTVSVGSREEVDTTYASLIAAGHESRQPPYDAFFGSRFAVIADPEGNDVGLMSPAEEKFRSWPPEDSPGP